MNLEDPVRACRVCGCTDDRACPGGCWWVGPDLCSSCGAAETLQAPACVNHPDRAASHTARCPSAEPPYIANLPVCSACAPRMETIGFPITALTDDELLEQLKAAAPIVDYQLAGCHHRGRWHVDVDDDGPRPEIGQRRPCYWCRDHGEPDAERDVIWLQPSLVDAGDGTDR